MSRCPKAAEEITAPEPLLLLYFLFTNILFWPGCLCIFMGCVGGWTIRTLIEGVYKSLWPTCVFHLPSIQFWSEAASQPTGRIPKNDHEWMGMFILEIVREGIAMESDPQNKKLVPGLYLYWKTYSIPIAIFRLVSHRKGKTGKKEPPPPPPRGGSFLPFLSFL